MQMKFEREKDMGKRVVGVGVREEFIVYIIPIIPSFCLSFLIIGLLSHLL